MGERKRIQSDLSSFTTDQLLSEVVRRRNETAAKDAADITFCDECVHVRYWTISSEPPKDFNVCSKGHSLMFRMPEDWEGPHGPSGFYRRVCADRIQRTPA